MLYRAERQTNGVEEPERDLYRYSNYSVNRARKVGYREENMEQDLCITQYLKMHYRWIKDMTITLKESMKKYPYDLSTANRFCNKTQKLINIQEKIHLIK